MPSRAFLPFRGSIELHLFLACTNRFRVADLRWNRALLPYRVTATAIRDHHHEHPLLPVHEGNTQLPETQSEPAVRICPCDARWRVSGASATVQCGASKRAGSRYENVIAECDSQTALNWILAVWHKPAKAESIGMICVQAFAFA